jgi:single-strand DNA-binding protein
MYLNKVFLYGNLTRDPEMRALPSGQQVASFALATNRTFKNKEGQKQEAVEFHNIVAFGRQAEVIGQYLKKGRPVFIEGRIQNRSWEKDGEKKYRTEIVVENFQFGPSAVGGGASRSDDGASAPRGKAAPAGGDNSEDIAYPAEEISPDDIPF